MGASVPDVPLVNTVAATLALTERGAASALDLLQQFGVPAWLADERGTLLQANLAFCQLLLTPHDQLCGTPVFDYVDTRETLSWPPVADTSQSAAVREVKYCRSNGDVIATETRSIGVALSDGRTGWLALVQDLTTEARINQSLRYAHQFLDAVVANSPLAIYTMDADGHVTSWNPAAERVFGLTREAALGRSASWVPHDRRDEAQQIRQRVLAGEVIEGLILERVRPDGVALQLQVAAAPLRDEHGKTDLILAVCADVTAANRTQRSLHQALAQSEVLNRALRRSELRMRRMQESIGDIVLLLDREGRIAHTSPSIARLLGMAPEEWRGRLPVELVYAEDTQVVQRAIDGVYRGEPFTRFAFRATRADGVLRWFEASASNYLSDPDVDGVVLNARDVTTQRERESRIAEITLHDPLTGAASRAFAIDRLHSALARHARVSGAVAIACFDIRGFAALNTRLGSRSGDEILVATADRIRHLIAPGDLLARIGSDEFLVVREGPSSTASLNDLSRTICDAVSREMTLVSGASHLNISVTLDAGCAQSVVDGNTADALLNAALARLREAKTLRSA